MMMETNAAASGVAPRLPRSLLPVLLMVCAVLPGLPAAAAVDVPGAGGVVVNGETIDAGQIWLEYGYQNSIRNFIHAKPDTGVKVDILKNVIEKKVNKQLLLQEARRLGYSLEEGDMEKVRQGQVDGWKGESHFQTSLKMLGVEESFILERAAETLLIRRMLAAESKAEEGVTEEVLLEHYEANPGSYLPEELPPLRYLFFPREQGISRSAYNVVLREAESLRLAGKSYASLVTRHSKHESAAGGGIVPERAKGEAGLPFQPVTEGLKECRLSQPRSDETGLHVYLRDCRQPIPFAEAKEKVRVDLADRRRSEFRSALMPRLRSGASISYLPLEGPPPLKSGAGQGH